MGFHTLSHSENTHSETPDPKRWKFKGEAVVTEAAPIREAILEERPGRLV